MSELKEQIKAIADEIKLIHSVELDEVRGIALEAILSARILSDRLTSSEARAERAEARVRELEGTQTD